MAILVTRPHPDGEVTATALRALGHEVWLAPALRFEPVAFQYDSEQNYDGVIVTSTNAIRAIAPQSRELRLSQLPLFAVGENTASAARNAGFSQVIVAEGDAASLRQTVLRSARDKVLKRKAALLYFAGADLSRDLATELGAEGFNVVTRTVYRMTPVRDLPREVCDGFAAHRIAAVLHYSRRSARAFLEAARGGAVEISALAVLQCCLSENVAGVLREAGASQVAVAASPDENALFIAMERALRGRLA